jgi:hypothetical protein
MTVAVAFGPRLASPGVAERRLTTLQNLKREPLNRRDATVIPGTGNYRGLKATATIAKSLRDECC